MPVLEHEQYRSRAADVREQVGDRRVETMALGIGVGFDRLRQPADLDGQVGQQPRQLAAAGTERGTQLRHSVTRTRRSSASTKGPYGVRTTASQAP